MTVIYERRPVEGPVTHAFVIGVGKYPHMQPNWDGLEDLRGGKNLDLPSAADSAKFVCDWLLKHQDSLSAKLGTVEVLISDPTQGAPRYDWGYGSVDPATEENIESCGTAWLDRLGPDDVAFFYCCGHGAALSSQPVLFLENLNEKKTNPWSHLNLAELAIALRHIPQLRCSFLFSDSCGEFLTNFQLGKPQDLRFWEVPSPFSRGKENVLLLCAAAEQFLAYEGELQNGGGVKVGRFTQILFRGMSGSSARAEDNKWMVYPSALIDDLKNIRRFFFPQWNDKPFEFRPAVTQNERHAIVFPENPDLPVVVFTEPEDGLSRVDLHISESNGPEPPWIKSRGIKAPEAWPLEVKGGHSPLYTIAVNGAAFHSSQFIPSQPRFKVRVFV